MEGLLYDGEGGVEAALRQVVFGGGEPPGQPGQLTGRVPLVRQGVGDQAGHRPRVRQPGPHHLLRVDPVRLHGVDLLGQHRHLGTALSPLGSDRLPGLRLLPGQLLPGLRLDPARGLVQCPVQFGRLLLEPACRVRLQLPGLCAEGADRLLVPALTLLHPGEGPVDVRAGLCADIFDQPGNVALHLFQLLRLPLDAVPLRLVDLNALPTAHWGVPPGVVRARTASTAVSNAFSRPFGGTPMRRASGPLTAISAVRGP